MYTIDMGRRTGTRATRKATRQGGAELPLITYTPNYREVEVERKELTTMSYPGVSSHTHRALLFTLQLPPNQTIPVSPAPNYPKKFEILFVPSKYQFNHVKQDVDEYLEKLKDTTIVFCTIIYKYAEPQGVRYSGQVIPEYCEAIVLDSFGNRHVCASTTSPSRFQMPGQFVATISPQYSQYTLLPFKTTVLPDSMIDALIEQEMNDLKKTAIPNTVVGPYRIVYTITLPHKPNPNTIPHRKFEPTAELADYLGKLEAEHASKPNKVSINTQTNTKNKVNSNTQTNRPAKVSMNTQTNAPKNTKEVNKARMNNNIMVLRSAPNNWAKQVMRTARNKNIWVNSNDEKNGF
jgi:hypothetical protein